MQSDLEESVELSLQQPLAVTKVARYYIFTAYVKCSYHLQKEEILSSKKLKRTIVKDEPPLPDPFSLPRNFPRVVQEGIEAGSLTGNARKKFITTVATSVYSLKTLPTKIEYNNVAKEIVRHYPFMADENGNHV